MDDLLSLPLARPLWDKLPHLPPLLRQWGDTPLGDIAARFARTPQGEPPVSSALLATVHTMTEPVLGPAVAEDLTARLAANSSILSANYHGVECFPEMVQAIHFFALHDLLVDAGKIDGWATVPVLSCASVSLQSQTYPRGLMLSRRHENGPIRLPFFPSSLQDTMAGRAPALTEDGLRKIRGHWFRKDKIPLLDWERAAVDAIMDGHVLRPEVLALPTFGGQVTRVNAALGAERHDGLRVRVVYLELEDLAARLLARDLEDETSVMHRILFEPRTRALVLDNLAGVRGCWRTEALNGLALGRTGRAGTVFFWMTDEKGRRCPLRLCKTPSGEAGLGYANICLPLRPRPVLDALAAGTIVPSLFTAYTSLTLDHGLRCFGGIFLADYLPAMIRGVAAAMDAVGSPLNTRPTGSRLAALPLTVRIDTGQGLIPAGTVELVAAGGLTRAQLTDISRLTLTDVLPLSLTSWYQEYVRPENRAPGWEDGLADLAARWRGVVVRPARP